MNLKEQYLEALKKDEETKELIRRNSEHEPEEGALNTPEKRACFRVGYDGGFRFNTGTFSHPDTPREKFHGIRMLHPHKATSNDAFYATLGASLSDAWK